MKVTHSNSTKIELEVDDKVHDLCNALNELPNGSSIALYPTGPNSMALYVTHK